MQLLSNQQRLHLVNTQQLYSNYVEAHRLARAHIYGMRWKTVRGVKYLFREKDRRGNGKLLGRRSPETERILAAFQEGKARSHERFAAIQRQLDEQARLNKALRLARVPRLVGRILRKLDEQDLLGTFTVLGTQAMYAYEAAGGVQFLLELLSSGDVDLLYDARKKLTLVCDRLDGEGLLGLLRKADRTFEPIRKQGFRAANAGQFMVDLIIAPRPMHENEPITFGVDDLVASEVPGLQWLVNSPKLETVAVDEDGQPVPFHVPDPRVFALHKVWLSQQPVREPIKKQRDLAQAQEIARMVREYMPHLGFDEALTSLHGDVRAMREILNI